jgi:Uma2 family endonuclease
MNRFEFHRRYEASNVRHAELIEGVVYVSSPLRAAYHGLPENEIGTWLGTYWSSRPGVHAVNNSTIFLDFDNELQPDLCMWRDGGSATLRDDGYLEGAPELVVEIAASTVSVDLNQKKMVYRRYGVSDYIVWRVLQDAVDWFVLDEGEYVALQPGDDGILESRVFPGLRLDVAALLADDLAGVLVQLR